MNTKSFVYNFLLAPSYVKWRNLCLVIFIILTSLNQIFAGGYKYIADQLGFGIYGIALGTIFLYIMMIYIFLKKVVKYLMHGNYITVGIYVVFCAFLFTIIPNCFYKIFNSDYRIFSLSSVLDNISSFLVYMLCIMGVTVPILLKNWIVSNKKLDAVRSKQRLSLVEQYKEQINPDLFFRILNTSENSVDSDPQKASDILMKLGNLLRYQLYDCNRQKTLLTAEISFLDNFLTLEKLCDSKFKYQLSVKGNIQGCWIATSILVPFISCVTKSMDAKQDNKQINIEIDFTTKFSVSTTCDNINNQAFLLQEIEKFKQRLNILNKGAYEVTINNNEGQQITKIALEHDN